MKRALIALLFCAAATPALAQDAPPDWDMERNPRNGALTAFTEFDTGLSIAVRCVERSYQALIWGLPAAGEGETRTLGMAFGDDEMSMYRWTVATDDTMAVGERPASFARKLRQGGRLQILVPGAGGEGRNLRHDLTLPVSSASIDETLTACGQPRVDLRDVELEALPDDGLPSSLVWANPPRPEYPSASRYGRGFAVVSCLANPNGTLRDCVVDSEHPHDGGFGTAALRAVRRAQVRDADDPRRPITPRLVAFRSQFVMSGFETPEEHRRRARARAAPARRMSR